MGFDAYKDHEPWEEPDKQDYDAVDVDLLNRLLMSHIDGLRPSDALVEFVDIQQTAQWYLAFNIDSHESRRRKWAQGCVAHRGDKTPQAVQDKVREVYDQQAGRQSAQDLFEDDLAAIEEAYQNHLDVR